MIQKFTISLTLFFCLTKIIAQKWEPIIEMDNNIFPSYILATANSIQNSNPSIFKNIEYRGDQAGIIGINITEVPTNTNVRIELSENDFFYKSSIDEKITDSTKAYYIYPKVNYKFDQLRNVNQQKPVNVEFKLFVNNDLKDTKIITSNVRSLEECPYIMKDYIQNKFVPIPWMFAAYVNEDSPLINEILSKALKTGIVNQFNGYQGDKLNTMNQVMAIWNALQDSGIKYSSITNTSLSSNQVASQRVRMIDQSYANSQANCVDGTVLFASLLKAIGIDPVLVLIPGHMFLGYYLDQNHMQSSFLETTMIGNVNLNNLKPEDVSLRTFTSIMQANKRLKELSEFQVGRTLTEKQQQISAQQELIKRLGIAAKKDASTKNFILATSAANEKYNAIRANFGKNFEYQIIDVKDARKIVKPIWR